MRRCGQKWIQRQFRGETQPSKHRFRPSEQVRPTFWQVTQVKSAVVSTCLELVILFLNLMPYAVPFFDVLFILNLSGR